MSMGYHPGAKKPPSDGRAGWIDAAQPGRRRKKREKTPTRAHLEARLAVARAEHASAKRSAARDLAELHAWWHSPERLESERRRAAGQWCTRPFAAWRRDVTTEPPRPGTSEAEAWIEADRLVQHAARRVRGIEEQLARREAA